MIVSLTVTLEEHLVWCVAAKTLDYDMNYNYHLMDVVVIADYTVYI